MIYLYPMRLIRFEPRGSGRALIGVQKEDVAVQIELPGCADLEDVIASPEALAHCADGANSGAEFRLDSVRLLAPLTRPEKILCLGLNYESHLREVGLEAPSEPTVFSKLANTIAGPTDPILIPGAAPRRLDYEAELAVVIGRTGREIPLAEALDYVVAATVANDVTARDWQLKKPNGQWLLGKSFDTFMPIGPALVTLDELPPLDSLQLRCLVNGETRQDAGTGEMLFGVAEIVSYLSDVCTLRPGDVILTGTPAGVGMALDPRQFLAEGDTVECTIEPIGSIVNTVSARSE
jgi:2-keto-4-pentenoate hydratase/2-oxohepta-3-ene-1,7-dioic acid hydratase in catechol pathway